jgi:TPR repeat protein
MVTGMDAFWYRKFFARAPKPDLKASNLAAGRGDAEAQFGLGLRYGSGTGEAQDLAQAAHWYRQAADQNHCLAQFNLGLMYASGQGVPRDEGEAGRWMRKAAEQGDAGAQFNLGTRSHRASVGGPPGHGVEAKIEAYKWFFLAAAQGYKDSAASCERMTFGMTREEVAEGNQRAASFVLTIPTDSLDR